MIEFDDEPNPPKIEIPITEDAKKPLEFKEPTKPKELPVKMKPEPNPNGKGIYWKIYSLALILVFLLGMYYFGGLIDKGRLMQDISSTTNNNYTINTTIKAPVTSNIQNEYENKFTFNLDIDEELIKNFCNST